jgi:hypothetical protein
MTIEPAGLRVTEAEVSLAVIAFLRTCSYGEADFNTIRFNLPKFIKLSTADREVSHSRAPEPKWFGIVRNIGAHADQPGNAIYEGLLVKRRGGGYQLASKVKKPSRYADTMGPIGYPW